MAYFGTLAPYIAPQGGPNGVNHISMYLGYHNIEIKTRDILKLNFGIWNIAGSKPDSVLMFIEFFQINSTLEKYIISVFIHFIHMQ